MGETLGKKAEEKIRVWLDRPELGYSFDRIPDQMNGQYGSKNICDFTCYKFPYMYYIESKSTYEDRFDFSMITDYQYENLLRKSQISEVRSYVIVLFATYQQAFILNIQTIDNIIKSGKKSINIKKKLKWGFPYYEIPTIPSRKQLLDYTGDLPEQV